MKYPLLALDLDGTLTNSQKEISSRTYRALMHYQKQGGRIILASGRPAFGVEPLADDLQLERYNGYVLSYNGALVQHVASGEIVFSRQIPAGALEQVWKSAKELHLPLLTHENNVVLTEEPDNFYIRKEAAINHMQVTGVNSLQERVDFPVYKCIGVGDPDELAGKEAGMRQMLGEAFSVYRSEPFFLEIMRDGVDKARSLLRLLEHLHCTPEDLCACGDGYNDISMVRLAGLGVAMQNGNARIKEIADYITCSNDEDGIAHLLEACIL